MRLGFRRPKYVKTGQRLDLDTHSNRPVYNYIEWLCDTARKYGIFIEYGESAKGHYVEIVYNRGMRAEHRERIYTLSTAKWLRRRILQDVSNRLMSRKYEKEEDIYEKLYNEFVDSFTPAQRAFWMVFKTRNKKLFDR